MLGKNLILAAAGNAAPAGYQISRSLRFNSADTAYLSRTPGTAGNRKTFTWSCWVKRGSLGSVVTFFSAAESGGSNPRTDWQFNASNALYIAMNPTGSSWVELITTPLFRDPSAWYHIVVAIDTTQATSSNRTKLYVNGTQVTSFSTEQYPSQNTDLPFNNTWAHSIGRYQAGASAYFNGYLADINFVDGQALAPTDFGQTNATTGAWEPKAYAGTYGTNGFHLDFSDNTSTTTLGYDAAGSNDWTLNNFSVAAGAGNDSLVDTPTPYGVDTGAGGEVRGNYCTWNPLDIDRSNLTTSNGNLTVVKASNNNSPRNAATFGATSGKWYWEVQWASFSGGTFQYFFTGVTTKEEWTTTSNGFNSVAYIASTDSNFNGYKQVRTAGSTVNSAYGSGYNTPGDIVGVALDLDAGTVTFYKNGVSQGAITLPPTSEAWFPFTTTDGSSNSATIHGNFGQRPFAHTAPSGFKALCTQNIAEGTITTSGTFTGNGSTDGPFVYLNGVPTAMTIDGNAVTFGTHADKLANGFKVRSSSASYNANATSMSYTISTTGAKFKYANAQPNP